MTNPEFDLGVKHGEYVGEIIVGLLVLSGGGSVIVSAVKACKTVEVVAKTYKRINRSSVQLFNDAIDASFEAFQLTSLLKVTSAQNTANIIGHSDIISTMSTDLQKQKFKIYQTKLIKTTENIIENNSVREDG